MSFIIGVVVGMALFYGAVLYTIHRVANKPTIGS
jgi:hypothetical protein